MSTASNFLLDIIGFLYRDRGNAGDVMAQTVQSLFWLVWLGIILYGLVQDARERILAMGGTLP